MNQSRHFKIFSIFLFAVFFCLTFTQAQMSDYDYKIGGQINALSPRNEWYIGDNYKISYLARVFGRYELSSYFDAELGAGFGSLAGVDATKNYYRTQMIPVDLRLLFSPFEEECCNPYLFIGIGGMHFDVTNKPAMKNNRWTKSYGYAAFVPVGLGVEIPVAEDFLLDLQANYTQTFTDNLNNYNNFDKLFSERTYDGYLSAGVGVAYSSSGSSDNDKDGLTKREELQLGTDPNNPDTDGDGLNDGEEINQYKTDPLKADTDGDGLNDGEEVSKVKTSPVKADTDGDGLNDGEEINKFKTEPLKADTDGDGLNDGEEVNKYKTNPLKADTDGDGLNDGDEVKKHKTDPLKTDTDGEGLSDGEEINKTKTNPLVADTDAGSVNDFVEVKRGTNPNNAEDDVILELKEDTPIVLEGVNFKSGKADVLPESEEILSKVVRTLKAYPDMKVAINGYTDSQGGKAFNQKLSERRAKAVMDWLIAKGIDKTRLSSKGFGPENPVADNATAEGRAKNRRIEFAPVKK